MNGRLTRLTMKPGASAERTGVLPQSVIRAAAASTTDGSAPGGATTSTSAISGAGLKKWRPTTRSGYVVAAAAIAATDRALVFVARIVPGGATASSRAKTRRFSSRSSRAASITRSADPERLEVGRRLQPVDDGRRTGVGRRLPPPAARRQPARPAGQPVGDPGPSPLEGGGIDVVEEDPGARLERDLGDPGTHRAGADDAEDERTRAERGRLGTHERQPRPS